MSIAYAHTAQPTELNGKKYSAVEVSDMAAEIHEGVPVVARLEKNGSACHFVTVVGTDTSQSGMDVYQISLFRRFSFQCLQKAQPPD